MNIIEIDDSKIIQEIIAGNHNALSVLYEKYKYMLYSQIYHLVHNEDDSLDILQDCFVKFISSINKKGELIKNIPGFLRRIAINQSLDYLRSQKRREVLQNLFINPISKFFSFKKPYDKMVQKELHNELMKVILKLSPIQQKIICLRHFEELKISEIATVCSCTIGTVKQHLHRAYKKLQNTMDKDIAKDFLKIDNKAGINYVAVLEKEYE